MSRLLTPEEITKAMEKAMREAQEYAVINGKTVALPEREVAKAQDSKTASFFNTPPDEELREEIAKKIPRVCNDNKPACKFYEYSKCEKYDDIECRYQVDATDQILSHIGDKRQQERKRILKELKEMPSKTSQDFGIAVAEWISKQEVQDD